MVTLFGIATAPAAVPMLLGLTWRKATNLGAVSGFIAGTAVGLALYFLGPKDEVVLFGLALKMEIVMFLGTAFVTFVVMAVLSLVWPAAPERQERTDAFMHRLTVPIGGLPGEREAAADADIPSPFRVVGIAIALIGLLLLCTLPWVGGGLVFVLDAVIGLALALGGGLIVWGTRKPPLAQS